VRVLATVLIAAATVLVVASDALASRTALFVDGRFAGEAAAWTQTAELGVTAVRIDVPWNRVAPTRPARPRVPSDAAYQWDEIDRLVEEAAARGHLIVLSVGGTPDWARADGGRGGGSGDPAWLPTRSAWRNFVFVVATRYSGGFDPDGGGPRERLPRVDTFEIWPAPNRAGSLRPQRRGSRLLAVAFYKRILTGAEETLLLVGTNGGYPITTIAGNVADATGPGDTDPAVFLRAMARARIAPSEVGLRLRSFTDTSALVAPVDRAWPARTTGIWVIDYAAPSGPPGSGSDQATQAAAVARLLATRADPRVRYAEWGSLRDAPADTAGFGLRDAADQPKQAWSQWLALR